MNRRGFLKCIGSGAAAAAVAPTAVLSDTTLATAAAPSVASLDSVIAFKTALEASYGLVDALVEMRRSGGLIGGACHTAKVVVGHTSNMLHAVKGRQEGEYLRRILSPSTRQALLKEIGSTLDTLAPASQRAFAEQQVRSIWVTDPSIKGCMKLKSFASCKEDPTRLFLQDWLAGLGQYDGQLKAVVNTPALVRRVAVTGHQGIQARIAGWVDTILAGDPAALASDPLFRALQAIHLSDCRAMDYSAERYQEFIRQAEAEGFPRELVFDSSEECELYGSLERVRAELDNFLISSRGMRFPDFMIDNLCATLAEINSKARQYSLEQPVWADAMSNRIWRIIEEHRGLEMSLRDQYLDGNAAKPT